MKSKRRTYTRRRSDLVLAFCGGVVAYVIAFRADSSIAETAVSMAFFTAGAVLGIYQAVGHADLKALKGPQSASKGEDDA